MSLEIISAGILDTVQDGGRRGNMFLGINPGGFMDPFSAMLANALLGKELNGPVIEMHFPAAHMRFHKSTIMALCGADFTPVVNGAAVPLNHPFLIKKGAVLEFKQWRHGMRCYLSILHPLKLHPWMNSVSTNLKTHTGGYCGRALRKDDLLEFTTPPSLSRLEHDVQLLSWSVQELPAHPSELEFVIGSEWYGLTAEAMDHFQNSWFQIRNEADRMGYRLSGPALDVKTPDELVSSGVSRGTVQLLPNGQLIILMADHQTTGGYPRIAHIISAHHHHLAQKGPNEVLRFRMTDLATAEEKSLRQEKYLKEIQNACKFKMQNLPVLDQ